MTDIEANTIVIVLEALGALSFPLAFLVITYAALRAVVPIIKEVLEANERVLHRISVTQDNQNQLLREQAKMLADIDARLTAIEQCSYCVNTLS